MKTFSGIRDVDAKILQNLSDKDLVSVCLTNKYANSVCELNSFWRDRYISTFGQHASEYKPEDRSWKNQYLQTLIDLNSLGNPVSFFDNILWDIKNGTKDSYFVVREQGGLQNIIELIPFSEGPEWFMNYFWLKKMNIKINLGGGRVNKEYKNVTPKEILEKISQEYQDRDYISKFIEYFQFYIPHIVSKEEIIDLL